MLKQIFHGFIRMHILFHASRENIYGMEIIEELRRHGYKAGPGTVYPILHQMEKEGYLESRRENVGGKMRVYYGITPGGREALAEGRIMLKELVHEVLGEEGNK
ncbi:MAG: PadR family transcriptional regulator [Deltaproteobacteria bacterium]